MKVDNEDIPIVPILIDEDDDGTETSDESSKHLPGYDDKPKEEDDTIVESVDNEDQQ